MSTPHGQPVFVTGHRGLAGSSLVKELRTQGFSNVLTQTRDELDLRERDAVFSYFETNKPQWVFIAAATVGGIIANKTYPVDFLLNNLKIQNNLMEAAHKFGTEKLMFLASNCMYPKLANQPVHESSMLTGPLEPTNEPYAIAKLSGTVLCESFNRQHGTNFITAVPTTLYGPNDNYHPENAHVLPMLLRRFHESKEQGLKEVVVWGSGTPKREFLHTQDFAKAAIFLMKNHNASDLGRSINIGTGDELSIRELAEALKEVVGLEAELRFDTSKPDGMPRKLLDSQKMLKLGWKPEKDLREGLAEVYDDFLNNPEVRK